MTRNQVVVDRLRRMLSTSVEDPSGLLSVMRDTNAVISGSTALSFFTGPALFLPTDLDLYTPKGWSQQLQEYLTNVEDYQPIPFTDDVATYYEGAISVTRMHRGSARIDVVEASDETIATQPICDFWTPVLRNFIGFDRYSCAYPAAVEAKIAMVAYGHQQDEHILDVAWKYKKRGFHIEIECDPDSLHGGELCPSVWRSFADELCLKGVFDAMLDTSATTSVGGLNTNDDEVVWRLGGASCSGCQRTEPTVGKSFRLCTKTKEEVSVWLKHEGKSAGGYEEYAKLVERFIKL